MSAIEDFPPLAQWETFASEKLPVTRLVEGGCAMTGRIAATQLGFDDSALKVAGGRPALGSDLKFRKLEPWRHRAAAQDV